MIRGELVNIRAVERSDAGSLHLWFNDPDLMRYWGVPDAAMSLAEVQRRIEAWIDDEAQLGRPVCLMAETLDGESIGLAILSLYDARAASAEVSMMIGQRERWGEGFGRDMLTTLVDTCFLQWRLHRLTLRVEAFNERAMRLYEGFGFLCEGTLRGASYFDGKYHDQRLYGLLVDDYLTKMETMP